MDPKYILVSIFTSSIFGFVSQNINRLYEYEKYIIMIIILLILYTLTSSYHMIIYNNIRFFIFNDCRVQLSYIHFKSKWNVQPTRVEGKYFKEVLYYIGKNYSHLYKTMDIMCITSLRHTDIFDTSAEWIYLRNDNIKIYSYIHNDKDNMSVIFYYVISGIKNNIDNFLDKCLNYYIDNHRIDYENKKPSIYYLLNVDTKVPCTLSISTIDLIANRTLSNIIFEQKHQLKMLIDTFMGGSELYRRIGKPHNLGILLSGQPGTGKTSLIKAIAQYMNRNLYIINLAYINDYAGLFTAFTKDYLDDWYVPISKRIIVMEDIDCMSSAVLSRPGNSTGASANDETSGTEAEVVKIHDEDSDSEFKKDDLILKIKTQKKTSITLSDLLNCIDGVAETDGRVIIMTTNFPERLDPALIRYGRIDAHIHMKYFNKDQIIEYLNMFYQTDLNEELALRTLKEFVQPAELENMCFQHKQEDVIELLFV